MHWEGEENGIFAVSARDRGYADYVAPLVVEHRELARLLDTVDISAAGDRQALKEAFAELREHISKEEDVAGLAPLVSPGDAVLLHDPQTAGLAEDCPGWEPGWSGAAT